jgi:hypothetical protein
MPLNATIIHFKSSSLSFSEVIALSKEYYLIQTWNKSELVYAIVMELSPNGKVNNTISN